MLKIDLKRKKQPRNKVGKEQMKITVAIIDTKLSEIKEKEESYKNDWRWQKEEKKKRGCCEWLESNLAGQNARLLSCHLDTWTATSGHYKSIRSPLPSFKRQQRKLSSSRVCVKSTHVFLPPFGLKKKKLNSLNWMYQSWLWDWKKKYTLSNCDDTALLRLMPVGILDLDIQKPLLCITCKICQYFFFEDRMMCLSFSRHYSVGWDKIAAEDLDSQSAR